MNVYDAAHSLNHAIKESEEFKRYDHMRQELEKNPELARMVQEMQTKQIELQTRRMVGECDDAEMMSQMQQMTALLMRDPLTMQYMEAQTRFSLMMKDVYEIVGESMGFGDLTEKLGQMM